MRTYDLSPLYRATVGFDRLATLLDGMNRSDEQAFSYPPYNIEKVAEDQYRISMAVAGFAESDLELTVKEGSLIVTGKKSKPESESETSFLYRGIAQRAFERRFDLADHIKVTGASMANGLLHIELMREVPETLKPRSIKIAAGVAAQPRVIENAQAA